MSLFAHMLPSQLKPSLGIPVKIMDSPQNGTTPGKNFIINFTLHSSSKRIE